MHGRETYLFLLVIASSFTIAHLQHQHMQIADHDQNETWTAHESETNPQNDEKHEDYNVTKESSMNTSMIPDVDHKDASDHDMHQNNVNDISDNDKHQNHDVKDHNNGVESTHSGHGGTHAGGHYGFFHLTTKTILLFEQLQTSTWQEILGACFAFGIAAVFYEGLKTGRQVLLERSRETSTGFISVTPSVTKRIFSCAHIIQSFLHVVQVVYAYLLMLAFMTFNGWICIAIAVGSGIGYFIFSFNRAQIVDNNEHCL